MTIQEIQCLGADPGPLARPAMLPTGGGCVAAPTMEPLSAGGLDLNAEDVALICGQGEVRQGGYGGQWAKASLTSSDKPVGLDKGTERDGVGKKHYAEEKGRKSTRASKENLIHDGRVAKVDGSSTKDTSDVCLTANALNRLSGGSSGAVRRDRHHEPDFSSQAMTTVSSVRRREARSSSTSQDRKRAGASRERQDSFIGENIAGNNAGHYDYSEELLPIQLTGVPDAASGGGGAASCVACGEGIPNSSSGYCKQCLYRNRHADSKGGTLDEIIAYAQNLALSVKKMLTIKGTNEANPFETSEMSDVSQSTEASSKLHAFKGGISYFMGHDDKQPRRLFEVSTPAPSVCGDDLDNMSVIDGEPLKDTKTRLARQTSSIASTDNRPPLTRAKTKMKALFSTSRTKTFRNHVTRTRTGHELKHESSVGAASSRLDGKRGAFPDTARKSGRTQTFDSSNLHLRKETACRTRLSVIQEGTPVDPPSIDDCKTAADRAHKYALSRSATSPGTNIPGINKFQREKSGLGAGGPLIRTNTKLTLRANKAAVLRMETIQKANTLFSNPDTSEGSPVLDRKRSSRQQMEAKRKAKSMVISTDTANSGDTNAFMRDVVSKSLGESFVASDGSSSRQETVKSSPAASQQHSSEQINSDIYCGHRTYIPTQASGIHVVKDRTLALQSYEAEIPERNPYCDDLHHYGKGLENQLLQITDGEKRSAAPLTPYFEKSLTKEDPVVIRETAKENTSIYTDDAEKSQAVQSKPAQRTSAHWYSIHGVISKSSTQLRQTTSVRSSLSDVVATRASLMGVDGPHARKMVKYTETDVDSGTIYHMAKRIASEQKVASHTGFVSSANFFEIGGDVSKSSSSTSGNSSMALDAEYTGGFFKDTFEDSFKKEPSDTSSSSSENTYFEYEGSFKPEAIECDIYTGSVFSPSANNLALSGYSDNWKNKSTNNSNRLPPYRCRARTTVARVNNRRILNCSNNSSSSLERGHSPPSRSPTVTESMSSSYIDYTGSLRHVAQPVKVSLPVMMDFTKYDKMGMDDTGFFFSKVTKRVPADDGVYEDRASIFKKVHDTCSSSSTQTTSEDVYAPGDPNTNANNNHGNNASLNSNNNYFGDFYTDDDNASKSWGASQDRRSSQSTTSSSGDFTSHTTQKYAPGSFYENAYAEPQQSPPAAQPQNSSFFGMFTGYGEPTAAAQPQCSPEYAGAFSYNPLAERQARATGGSLYEGYGRTASTSPKCQQSYDCDGYFDYHSSTPDDDQRSHPDLAGLSPTPVVPKIKRVGAIICRENVANKDDYAEDVNRDLMEDPWIPISYRLAAEQVKEMGGGRCSSKDFFKSTEGRMEASLMDGSPFAQGQILEALGRKTSTWNLKQNTDTLKEDISMKWRDAREKSKYQQQQQQNQPKTRKSGSESTASKTLVSSVWRPTDHIPAKARGNRIMVKSEPRGPTVLDGANSNNSRVWSAVMWVPSTVGSYVKKLW